MTRLRRARFLDHLDKLTKSDKENVGTMLRVGAEMYGRDGFNLVRCEESNKWQVYRKVNRGNAGIDAYEKRQRSYASEECF
ncbi:hypothetical protein CN681_18650 [Bacillus toyonensis]|uniref:Uncharacterized protein n=1 Tax=Bacillus cereus TaxID=1396 RepID=A0A2B3U081_BACCE|nr:MULTISPECIES: hypothetical protein [Bacillus cereus group]PED62549.1 hypothetical protein CON89_03475 [Bacillus toyonensis]PEK07816.1 hypothetical protein CN681_18650 [Bacillus toyonensis]PEM97281.1 hypothetical protein CN629_03115 [Bacillus toyonensis]PEN35284.1 hypothetical protein CN541_23150 [Bacillus toyonensis]PFU40064.1 hypothetical protein COK86_19915 [Bacillus cereus]